MTNPPKARGTRTETMLVRLFTAYGLPAERRALKGAADEGDLWLHGGRIVVEAKHRKTSPSPEQVRRWMAETQAEAGRVPQCELAALIVNRPGYGVAGMAEWDAWMRIDDAVWLMGGVDAHKGRPDLIRLSLGTFALLAADLKAGAR